ncbi:MAG: nodulation protein NfeD [Nitrospirae bacterium]|nr:MAG: nodulation protein NfeD [Nitrospirota bacterium]
MLQRFRAGIHGENSLTRIRWGRKILKREDVSYLTGYAFQHLLHCRSLYVVATNQAYRLTCLLGTVACALSLLLPSLSLFAYAEQPLIVVATYEGVINPVAAEYLHEAITYAEAEHAHLLIFQLDTPGGLDTSMRTMIKDMTSAHMPVVVYVAPTGARAASAGVFITLAAHVAAMAPGTNIGAAHPVAMGGGEMDTVMKEKVENDAVAYIRSIAERRGRNPDWAEKAVRKSISATARDAKKLGIIDVVAEDLTDLFTQLNGWKVPMGMQTITLKTAHATITEFPMNWRLEALKAISDPNIAYVLMTIGMIGLIAELYNPGAILPGIVGAISLILAFYSFQSLPVNYAGVLLILLGIVMLILEVTVTSYGLLAIGGVISMVLGSLMLMNEEFPYYQISWSVILPVVASAVAFTFVVLRLGIKALRGRTVTGSEGMIGLRGVAKTPLTPQGKVFVHGELWDATSTEPVQVGAPVEVIRVDGLMLQVKPVANQQGETVP